MKIKYEAKLSDGQHAVYWDAELMVNETGFQPYTLQLLTSRLFSGATDCNT